MSCVNNVFPGFWNRVRQWFLLRVGYSSLWMSPWGRTFSQNSRVGVTAQRRLRYVWLPSTLCWLWFWNTEDWAGVGPLPDTNTFYIHSAEGNVGWDIVAASLECDLLTASHHKPLWLWAAHVEDTLETAGGKSPGDNSDPVSGGSMQIILQCYLLLAGITLNHVLGCLSELTSENKPQLPITLNYLT